MNQEKDQRNFYQIYVHIQERFSETRLFTNENISFKYSARLSFFSLSARAFKLEVQITNNA